MDFSSGGLTLASLLCVALLTAQAHRECLPGGHRILRNPRRSTDFDSTELQNTAIQDLICDHNLAPGWYRFTLNNRPAEMPTSCVEMNHCGTQAPVWLSLQGSPLPAPGQLRQLAACATWQFFHGSAKDCCLFRIPISIRNCGQFMVYYLQPTQGCMGYCAKAAPDVAPRRCPPGEIEANGKCTAPLPPLLTRPIITSELVGSSVHLRCSFSAPPWRAPLGYRVVWARHIGRGMKAEARQESTRQPFSLVEMDGVHFRLGETFSCSVSVFEANSSQSRSSVKESESFFAGVQFSPGLLHIAEDGQEHQVAVSSTVPIPCYGQQGGQCSLSLTLSVHDPDSRHEELPDVALSDCQVELRPGPCNSSEACGSAMFTVTAVTDFTRDHSRASLITAHFTHSAPRLWTSYTPTPLKVVVQDLPTSICYSLTDPHVLTLDGRRYENHQTGTFVLYRSRVRSFEVHSRQWDCGSRQYAVACTCGVAVREGNEVAILDMCNGQRQETRPQLTLNPSGSVYGRGRRVRVLESHQGKKVTLLFPSGAFVRADVSDWGMSLAIRAPSVDYTHTLGLCGTFDHNVNNDLQGPDSTEYSPQQVSQFIDTWRIRPGDSLFDRTPSLTEEDETLSFCHCPHSAKSSAHTQCTAQENVDYTSVFPSMDTTLEYLKDTPSEDLKDSPSEDLKDSPPEDLKDSPSEDLERSKRQAIIDVTVVSAHSLTAQHHRFSYFFPEDHLAVARPVVEARWPTSSGLTSAKALELCQLALANSTVGTVCRGLLGRRLDEAVHLCMLDLQLKDDLSWEDALMPFLENECERRLLENRTQRILELGHLPGGQGAVVTALRCPNLCSGNGLCTEWGCQCYPGHSFSDCSVAITQPVEITDLENSGLCDMSYSDCRSVRVFGLGFIDSADLSCYVTRLMHINGAWLSGEKQRTKAIFLSSKALDCSVPSQSGSTLPLQDFLMNDKPYSRWEIKVTNDGSQWSEGRVLTIFDGVCLDCEATHTGLCKLKEGTCSIEGMCFSAKDANPSSPCLHCDPHLSTLSWSVNQVNEAPVFHPPQERLQTFAGENFVFQFAASDPEGSGLLFQLDQGPPGATLSPAGLLIWKVPLVYDEVSHLIHFSLSDECNARSSVTVEVSVVPCGCQRGDSCVTDVQYPAGRGRYLCVCPPGRTGELCAEDIDQCLSAPCPTGVCINTPSGFRCECPPGLTGVTCQQDVDECALSPCYPGVHCFNTFGSFRCGPCPRSTTGNGTQCTANDKPVSVPSTPVPLTTVLRRPHVLLSPSQHLSSSLLKTPRVQVSVPASAPVRTVLKKNPALTAHSAFKKNTLTKNVSRTQANNSEKIHHLTLGGPRPNQDKSVAGVTVSKEFNNIIPQEAHRSSGLREPRVGSSASVNVSVSSSCASRPCFPGVQCIDRRPPHVGYVCGRCPHGLHGNGRVCVKDPKAGFKHNLLKPVLSRHEPSRVSLLHLPSLPHRHNHQHLSPAFSKARGLITPWSAPGRGGGTGRREAASPPPISRSSQLTPQGSNLRPLTADRKVTPHGTVTAINRPEIQPSKLLTAPKHTTPSHPSQLLAERPLTPPQPLRPHPDHLQTSLQPPRPRTTHLQKPLLPQSSRSVTENSPTAPQPPRSLMMPQHYPLQSPTVHLQTPAQPPRPLTLAHNTPPQPPRPLPLAHNTPPQPPRPLTLAHNTPPQPHRPLTLAHNTPPQPPRPLTLAHNTPPQPPRTSSLHHNTPLQPARHLTILQHTPSQPFRRLSVHQHTPLQPPRPLTGALTTLSLSLSESEFSADGEEEQPTHGPELDLPALPLTTPDRSTLSVSSEVSRGVRVSIPALPVTVHALTCADQPCFPGVQCLETPDGSFRCVRCPVGYTGDGRTCRAVCRHSCGRNMECAAPNTCRCKPGYSGSSCETAVCEPACVNGGVCIAPGVCQCPRGFHGETCQEVVCRLPCENGGSCVGPQTCSCPFGYVGPRCETMVCSLHCHHGGRCVSPDRCECALGWTGPSCETAQCSPVCLNGGLCVRPDTCHCPQGFYGAQCQNAVCSPPCKNGGVCVRSGVCSCPLGYSGQRCETNVCEPMCRNGGRCVGPNVCDCPSGWRGQTCDRPRCLQNCLNGGECVGPNTCHCPAGWLGLYCQTPHCVQKCQYGSRCVRPAVCACPPGARGSLCRKLSSHG